jgi:5-methylcytosine-specific restriction enzyme subunit McrC
MGAAVLSALPGAVEETRQSQIPIRNLWFLLLYAADLAEFLGRFDSEADGAADVADLVALLLAHVVEQRVRRNLSRAYLPQSAVLTRVRGRIDAPQTWSGQHIYRGRIVCRFDELSVDTPRNRLARAALERISAVVEDDVIARRCLTLARDLMRMGVSAARPSRSELSCDQIARHDGDDRQMVAASTIALDLVLPSETEGKNPLTRVARDNDLLPRIFQGAITGFYRHELERGWRVAGMQCDAGPVQHTPDHES